MISILPYIDGFQISIDGLGKVNERYRGINGGEIMVCIERLVSDIKRQEFKKLIHVVPVITNYNYLFLPLLVEEVHRLSPDIQTVCIPMRPYHHPDSIAANPKNYKEFVELLEGLIQRGFKIRVNGPFSKQGLIKEVPCQRQYFRLSMGAEGNLIYCKPYRFIEYFLDILNRALKARDIQGLLTIFKRILQSLIIHRYDVRCPFPCSCDDFIDIIFLSKSFDELWRESYELLLKVNEYETKDAYKFIKKYINPNFNIDFFNTEKLKLKNGYNFKCLPIFMYSKDMHEKNINEIAVSKS